jgi:CheY-like chemotaxis protein
MTKKLKCILLVDDDDDCNFFHERLLKKMLCTEQVHIARNGEEALNYITSNIINKKDNPDLILLDINMPKMNGWEFLDNYKTLDEIEKAKINLIMLTTSINPDDEIKSQNYNDVKGFYEKYLSEETLYKIFNKFFPNYLDN